MAEEETIADRMGRVRKQLGFTIEELGDACGFSKATMQYYLDGGVPSAIRIVDIADVLGVHVRWLVTGQGKKGT